MRKAKNTQQKSLETETKTSHGTNLRLTTEHSDRVCGRPMCQLACLGFQKKEESIINKSIESNKLGNIFWMYSWTSISQTPYSRIPHYLELKSVFSGFTFSVIYMYYWLSQTPRILNYFFLSRDQLYHQILKINMKANSCNTYLDGRYVKWCSHSKEW